MTTQTLPTRRPVRVPFDITAAMKSGEDETFGIRLKKAVVRAWSIRARPELQRELKL